MNHPTTIVRKKCHATKHGRAFYGVTPAAAAQRYAEDWFHLSGRHGPNDLTVLALCDGQEHEFQFEAEMVVRMISQDSLDR